MYSGITDYSGRLHFSHFSDCVSHRKRSHAVSFWTVASQYSLMLMLASMKKMFHLSSHLSFSLEQQSRNSFKDS